MIFDQVLVLDFSIENSVLAPIDWNYKGNYGICIVIIII